MEYEKLGGKDKVSMEKTEEVVAFIRSQLPDLDQAVFHVTNVREHELWTWQSTTPGHEDQTVRGLGATVLSKRQHEAALRGMLGAAYADATARWGIEERSRFIFCHGHHGSGDSEEANTKRPGSLRRRGPGGLGGGFIRIQ
jgi:hypothetical protein